MKIVLVSPHFPPHRIGGVEFYTKRLADYLKARGDAPEVICVERIDAPSPGLTVTVDRDAGYPVHRLSFNLATAQDPFRASYWHPDVEEWTRAFLDAARPDVLHLHSGYLLGGGLLNAAFRCGVPTVVTLHDFWFVCARITLLHPDGRRCSGPESAAKCAWCLATEQRRLRVPDSLTGGRLGAAVSRAIALRPIAAVSGWGGAIAAVDERNHVLREALMRADLVLAPSRFLRDLVVDTGVPHDRITISRYGIDVPAPRLRPPSSGERLRIGYLGQVAPHKGVSVLVDAVRRLPDAPIHLRIYGNPNSHGRYGEQLRAQVGADARIEFAGPYSHDMVYDILATLDVIVVPSIWFENAPFVIQEAQAAHVPVIASRLGGMRELVRDEIDGLLFDVGDSQDLARQIRRLLDDPGLLARLQPDGSTVRTEEDEMRELAGHYARLARRP